MKSPFLIWFSLTLALSSLRLSAGVIETPWEDYQRSVEAERKRSADALEPILKIVENITTLFPQMNREEKAQAIADLKALKKISDRVEKEEETAMEAAAQLLLERITPPPDLTPPPENEYMMFAPMADGQAPTANDLAGPICLLEFQTLSLLTGVPVTHPAIHSVTYEANLDPHTPDVFVPLGTSFDPASNFAMPFTIAGFEPLVVARPFDAAGHPVALPQYVGPPIDYGFVVIFGPSAIDIPTVPETGGLLLFPFALLSLCLLRPRSPR